MSEMRSGSTLLTDLLARRLPQVRMYGELLHRYGAWWDPSVDPQLALYEPWPAWVKQYKKPDERYQKFGAFIDSVCSDASAQAHLATGWKFLGFQRKWVNGCKANLGCDWERPLRAQLLRQPSVRKIVLQRRNLTAQFASFKRALRFGFWSGGHGTQGLALNASELREWQETQNEYYAEIRSDLKGQDYLQLWYEDDLLDKRAREQAVRRIANFLGVASLQSSHRREDPVVSWLRTSTVGFCDETSSGGHHHPLGMLGNSSGDCMRDTEGAMALPGSAYRNLPTLVCNVGR